MLIKILIALVVLVAAFVVVVALRPADFRISRTATIPAPAAAVFAQINDLHHFNDWSPWARIDPNAKYSFDGPSSGVGSSFAWTGNSEVGAGRMTITESQPQLIRMRLDFLKPIAATNVADFQLAAAGEQTTVTWTMTGTNGFMAKAAGLFMNIEKMVGDQFDQGLDNLKAVAANAPQTSNVRSQQP